MKVEVYTYLKQQQKKKEVEEGTLRLVYLKIRHPYGSDGGLWFEVGVI